MAVLLETSIGDLVIDLYSEKCPIASKNFLKLCKQKYYNNSLFGTIQKEYLTEIKTSTNQSIYEQLYGEQEKYFQDEIYKDIKYNKMGLVGCSNLGPNKNQANFFITLTDRPLPHLDGKHTIFGYIDPEEGKEILQQLNEIYTDDDNIPYYNIRIKHSVVLEDPFEDPENFKEVEESPKIENLKSENGRLEYEERNNLIDEQGRTDAEIVEATKAQKAKTDGVILEILGDIADADAAPPDNVLFVCKLNQATQESDLQIIFSRFGLIKKCEVVRDWKTGQSLQYAFIEFEAVSACQEAFFKMENVLIDERRIHVNFCQSQEKLWTKYKQRQQLRQLEENKKQTHKNKHNNNNGDDDIQKEQIVLKDQYKYGARGRNNNDSNYVFENNNKKNNKNDDSRSDIDSDNERERDEKNSKKHKKHHKHHKSSKKSNRSRSRSRDHHSHKHKSKK